MLTMYNNSRQMQTVIDRSIILSLSLRCIILMNKVGTEIETPHPLVS